MRTVSLETGLLGLLAQAPFLDRQGMAAISGGSRSVVYEAVHRLEEGGLVDSIPHAADLTLPSPPLLPHRRRGAKAGRNERRD